MAMLPSSNTGFDPGKLHRLAITVQKPVLNIRDGEIIFPNLGIPYVHYQATKNSRSSYRNSSERRERKENPKDLT
jgi:hypothetical protein